MIEVSRSFAEMSTVKKYLVSRMLRISKLFIILQVARDSLGNNCSSTGTSTAIEIPPPRPKRKPLHPYPRKLGGTNIKGIQVLKQLEKSSMQNSAICEQENRSPTSVLSTVGSEVFPSSCKSPISSATGSSEQENGGQSLTYSVNEENRCPSTPGLTTEVLPTMVIYYSTVLFLMNHHNFSLL